MIKKGFHPFKIPAEGLLLSLVGGRMAKAMSEKQDLRNPAQALLSPQGQSLVLVLHEILVNPHSPFGRLSACWGFFYGLESQVNKID